MTSGNVTMRVVLIAALVTALGGCLSIRHRHDDTASADGRRAPKTKPAKEPREVLPTGLAGDREHHAYTDTPN